MQPVNYRVLAFVINCICYVFQPHLCCFTTSHLLVAKVALRDCGFKELLHSPYSSDLAPCDFHLFPSLKGHLHGKHLEDGNELKIATEEWL